MHSHCEGLHPKVPALFLSLATKTQSTGHVYQSSLKLEQQQ